MPLTSVRRYSTPDQEPVVDISISNARHCLYIVGMETVGGRVGSTEGTWVACHG